MKTSVNQRKPPWIRMQPAEGPAFASVRRVLRRHRLGTVCQEARCPNRAECWGGGTATFLLLGERCTRSCRFCSVQTSREGDLPDPTEPERVAQAAAELRLRYVVLTSVSRDDLPDGGAAHYAATVRVLREQTSGAGVEVLIPDFLGDSLAVVVDAGPTVLAHNLEVVRELTLRVRDRRCSYDSSLEVLAETKRRAPQLLTKSSLLLGLGESDEHIESALDDLRQVQVDLLCLGQYLQPSRDQLPVARYLPPARFDELAELARQKGFREVAAGPLVRTSYHAADLAALEGPAPGCRQPAEEASHV